MPLLKTRKAKKLENAVYTHETSDTASRGLCRFTHHHGAEACVSHKDQVAHLQSSKPIHVQHSPRSQTRQREK